MLDSATQATRQLALFSPLGDDRLLLRNFTGIEQLSRPFEYRLDLLSAEGAIDPSAILGRNVTFLVRRPGRSPRYFNGFVRRFACTGREAEAFRYQANVVPWLWLLSQTAGCRIFQHETTPQIVEQVFVELGFTDFKWSGLKGEYSPREYCVQYRETALDFVSRLLEEEGMFYYFRHENGRHTLVLADHMSAYFPLEDGQFELADPDGQGDLPDQLLDWQHQQRLRPGRWAQTDYDFQAPEARLMSVERSVIGPHAKQALEVYDYPGRFQDPRWGSHWTRVRMEEEEADHDVARGTATYRSLTPGGTFTIARHRAAAEVGRRYVLEAVEQTASVNDSYRTGRGHDQPDYECRFRCIPDHLPFRPARVTPRPVVEGPQTAVVVGPRGAEIFTDPYGRVKLQFHWDREGRRDENSSCWVRVSQAHAGRGWGSIDVPRIGEEVIVSFLEGDPDRPLVKGRVYNGRNRPPFALPAEKTRGGGKSNTHRGSGYNEISADDTAGQEQVKIHAQHDMDTVVGNNQTLEVGVDRTRDVGNDDALSIAVDSHTQVGNNASVVVGNNATYEVANNLVIEAGTSITLQCGASTIHMNQAGVITISGTLVTSAAKAANNVVAPMTLVAGSQVLNQVGLVNLKLGGVAKINGARSTQVGGAMTSLRGGVVVVKGSPILLGDAAAPVVSLPAPSAAAARAAGGGAGGGGAAAGGAGEPLDAESGGADGVDLAATAGTPPVMHQPGEGAIDANGSPAEEASVPSAESPPSESNDQVDTLGANPGDGAGEPDWQPDTTRFPGTRKDLEDMVPEMRNAEYEIVHPGGTANYNCFAYVLGLEEPFQPEFVHRGSAQPYAHLDDQMRQRGYDQRRPFASVTQDQLVPGTVLVYEGPPPTWYERFILWSWDGYSGDIPIHAAVLNESGRWESVTGPGGALLEHADPGAVTSDKFGTPANVYIPGVPRDEFTPE